MTFYKKNQTYDTAPQIILLQQYQFLNIGKFAGFQSVEINTGWQSTSMFIFTIPVGDVMSGGFVFVDQQALFDSHEIVN